MSTSSRFATYPPARLEWHPAHGELTAGDPGIFHLHVEFVHAHGLPAGQFTTFSTCNPAMPVVDLEGLDGARGH